MTEQANRDDYDQTLKRLLTRAHDGFLHIVAPGVQWRGERSPELPATRRQADLVWEVEQPDGTRGLLHIELQIHVDANIRERLLEYNVRLMWQDGLPVRSLVVFLRKAGSVPQSPLTILWGGNDVLRFHFDIVRLWETPQSEVLETEQYGLWPLAPLMADATTTVITDVAVRLAATPLPRQERAELTAILATLAGIRFSRDEVAETIRSNAMISDILHESSFATIMRDEGKAEGKAEGQAEGREEGKRDLARMALEARFGPLSADMLAALQGVGDETLLDVVTHAATDPVERTRERLGLM